METVESLVRSSLDGNPDAYGVIVHRFQDMAVGYAYSVLRDFQLAEDAAQEAFFEAYRNLSKLREPAAFGGWFRKIVFKQCDRIMRGNKAGTFPLDVSQHDVQSRDPADVLEENEMKTSILEAVESLREHERTVTVLYYISGYSQDEVAAFLEVPTTTVKKRLHDARAHLREMLMDTVAEDLRSRRPSRTVTFAEQIVEFIKAARDRNTERIKAMLQQNPQLLVARDPLGNSALVIAMNSGYRELAEMLIDAGVQPNLWEAAAIGDVPRLEMLLNEDKSAVDAWSVEGFSPLLLASHFGHLEAVCFLLDHGADIQRPSQHRLGVTALHTALFGGHPEIASLLIDRGADVNARRGGSGWPRAGWTALHYAVAFGFEDLITKLIDHGADINARDENGATPLERGAK
jgi:RNA polymerase sigma factor (sigma-70 family)